MTLLLYTVTGTMISLMWMKEHNIWDTSLTNTSSSPLRLQLKKKDKTSNL